jgi:serine/threonine protein kinase
MDSDEEFEQARRAVDLGWLRREQVEEALLAEEREPGRGLLDRLPLDPEQRGALVRPLPPEVARAACDPAQRVGNYVRVAPLGSGGMGCVFRAWDLRLGRWAALKFPIRPEQSKDRAWFDREARLAASLSHPNVAAVYETGDSPRGPWIAMQFVDGVTLESIRDPLPPERAARLIRDAAAAVGAAHRQGIVHRDLKPANLMVDVSDRVFVLDFGLARNFAEESVGFSGSTLLVGTPEYMPPEQIQGRLRDLGPATDVYALGASLFRILAGRPPHVAEGRGALLVKVLQEEPPPLRRLRPEVPRDLETIVLRSLDKRPQDRYADAAELADDLDRFLAGGRIRARRRFRWKRWAAAGALLALLGSVPLLTGGAGSGDAPKLEKLGFSSDLSSPIRLTTDGETLYILDVLPGLEVRRLLGWREGGAPEELVRFGSPRHPVAMTVDAGRLFFVDPNGAPGTATEVLRRDRDGTLHPIYHGTEELQPIADGGGIAVWHGKVYVSDQVGGRVLRMAPDGSGLEEFAPARYPPEFRLEHFNAVAADADHLYFAGSGRKDVAAPQVLAWTPAGGAPRVLHAGAPLIRPTAIACGEREVYVADPSAGNAVWAIPKSGGEPRLVFAGPPLVNLEGIAWQRGSLLLADSGNHLDAVTQTVEGPGAVYRLSLPRR